MKNGRILFLKNIDREGPGHLLDVVTEMGYESDVILLNDDLYFSDFHARYDFLVVLGGPSSANDKTFVMQRQIEFVQNWLESGKPYLGICLGMQIMVKALNGRVVPHQIKEVGFHHLGKASDKYKVTLLKKKNNPLKGVLDDELYPFQLHGETVVLDKSKTTLCGVSNHCKHQVVTSKDKQVGLQFHIEMKEKDLRLCFKQDDDLLFINQELCLSAFLENQKRLLQNCKSLLSYLLKDIG